MTSVVILGPNLINQSKGAYHVHKTGCRNLGSYYGAEHNADKNNPMDFDSESEVAHFVFADFEDEMSEADMLGDIYFHNCVVFERENGMVHKPAPNIVPEGHVVIPGAGITVPAKKEETMTITFELYNEDMFLSLEIVTSDPENTLAVLESAPNVRNIKLH